MIIFMGESVLTKWNVCVCAFFPLTWSLGVVGSQQVSLGLKDSRISNSQTWKKEQLIAMDQYRFSRIQWMVNDGVWNSHISI